MNSVRLFKFKVNMYNKSQKYEVIHIKDLASIGVAVRAAIASTSEAFIKKHTLTKQDLFYI